MNLWQIGLIVFILGGLANTLLMHSGIGGILRELTRFSILAGLVLFLIGFAKRKKG